MLRKLLKNKPFCNDLHFFMIAVVLLLLGIYNNLFILLLILYLFFILFKTNYFPYILLLLIIVFSSYKINSLLLVEQNETTFETEFIVKDINDKNLILKRKYCYSIYNNDYELKPGDIIKAKIKVYELDEPSFKGDFNERSYYKSKGITNKATIISYEKIDERWSLNKLKYNILNFYKENLSKKSFDYLKAIIFGIVDLDEETKEAFSTLYISHILAISGMHIMFLYKLLVKLFEKIFRIEGTLLSIFIIGIYVFFIGFPSACLRAFLFLLFKELNKMSNKKYTSLDIFSITLILMIIIFPFRAFQQSFILSFVVSFFWIFMEEYVKNLNKINKNIISSLICVFSIFPFVVNQNNSFSILGIALSSFLGLFLSETLLPLCLFMLILPIDFYEVLFIYLDKILIGISDFCYKINIPYLDDIKIVIYYIIFIYILICITKRKRIYSISYLFMYIFILALLKFVNPYYTITFIDAGQGDSMLIEMPYNKGTILIDSYYNTEKYLKCRGISNINYVIITHFDEDHYKTIFDVCKSIKIDNIIYSYYGNADKIASINVKKEKVRSGDFIDINNIRFFVLSPNSKSESSNGNSVVLKFTINGYSFLATGDMTSKEEAILIDRYGALLKSDVLKVAHHGSRTSSSKEFINLVNPKYSIISVGKNNSYGLPASEVVRLLEKESRVFMTSNSGNIMVRINRSFEISGYKK